MKQTLFTCNTFLTMYEPLLSCISLAHVRQTDNTKWTLSHKHPVYHLHHSHAHTRYVTMYYYCARPSVVQTERESRIFLPPYLASDVAMFSYWHGLQALSGNRNITIT